jgi:tight adherence protein B
MSSGLIIFLSLLGGAVFLLSQVLIVPAFGSDARTRRLLRRKLEAIDAVDAEREVSSLLRQKYLRELSPFARRLEDSPHMESLGKLIEQSGVPILAHRLVLLALLAAIVAALVFMTITGNPVLAAMAFVAGGSAPFVFVFRKRRARLEKFEEQLPDAVDVMKRALRAGHPFSTCIKLVAEDMDEPIAREFEQTFADVNYGNDLRRALLGMLVRVPSSNLMAVVTAVLIQKETGGNLAEIFERISQVIRSRFRFGRRVRTLSAEGRLSAWILTLVPIVLFGVLWITTPSYLPPLLEHPTGQKMIVFAIMMMVVAVFWMRKIIRIDL